MFYLILEFLEVKIEFVQIKKWEKYSSRQPSQRHGSAGASAKPAPAPGVARRYATLYPNPPVFWRLATGRGVDF